MFNVLNQDDKQVERTLEVVMLIAFVFFVSAVLVILYLFGSRIVKTYYARRRAFLRPKIQYILNNIVINEGFSERIIDQSAFGKSMSELKTLIHGSRFARQLLIECIIDLKKNVTGNVATALGTIYYSFALDKTSVAKLGSFKWEIKAKGIRELAEMGSTDALPFIRRYANAMNTTLRQEAIMAMVRLDREPFAFLGLYRQNITPWMQINIHHYLMQTDRKRIPLFNKWFNSENQSVVEFCVNMTKHFRQYDAVPDLLSLTTRQNEELVIAAIDAIAELDASDCRNEIIRLLDLHRNNPVVCVHAIRCLGKIGERTDSTHLVSFLSHPAATVRFESLKVLTNFQESASVDMATLEYDDFEKMKSHLTEPLLK